MTWPFSIYLKRAFWVGALAVGILGAFSFILSAFAQSGEPIVKWEIGKTKNILYKWSGHEIGDILNIALSWADSETAAPEAAAKGITLKEFTLTNVSGQEKEKFELPQDIPLGLYKIKIESRNATGTIASVLGKKTFEVLEKEKKREPKPGETKIDQLNEEVLDLIKEVYDKPTLGIFGDYKLKSDPKAAAKEEKLKEVLKERRDEMVKLIQINPAEALIAATLKDKRQKLPAKIQQFIEREIKDRGILTVIYSENFTDIHKNKPEYYFKTNENSILEGTILNVFAQANTDAIIHLNFVANEPEALSGSEIAISGIELSNQSAVDQSTIVKAGKSSEAKNQETIIIAVDFPEFHLPFSGEAEKWAKKAPSFLNSYFQEVSYGKMSFENPRVIVATIPNYEMVTEKGKTLKPITLKDLENVCDEKDANPRFLLMKRVVYSLKNNIDFPKVGRVIIFFPTPSCIDDVKGIATFGYEHILIKEKLHYLSISWIPIMPNINPEIMSMSKIILHEMGHNLGLKHSELLYNCSSDECSHEPNPYDYYDLMGYADKAGHLNAAYKYRLGWVEDKNVISISKSGTYSINPIEKNTDGPQILKIGRDYYIEYRQALGWDGKFSCNNFKFKAGAQVRRLQTDITTLILPITKIENIGGIARGLCYLDQVLPIGKELILPFYDDVDDVNKQISITPIKQTPEELMVEITFGAQEEESKIEILTPDKPVSLGEKTKITWKSQGLKKEDLLDIRLFKKSGLINRSTGKEMPAKYIGHLFKETPNDGEEEWTVPLDLKEDNYIIDIGCWGKCDIKEDQKVIAEKEFSITKASLEIFRPWGGENFIEGTKKHISFERIGFGKDVPIYINLVKKVPTEYKLTQNNFPGRDPNGYDMFIDAPTYPPKLIGREDLDTCDGKISGPDTFKFPYHIGKDEVNFGWRGSPEYPGDIGGSYQCPQFDQAIKNNLINPDKNIDDFSCEDVYNYDALPRELPWLGSNNSSEAIINRTLNEFLSGLPKGSKILQVFQIIKDDRGLFTGIKQLSKDDPIMIVQSDEDLEKKGGPKWAITGFQYNIQKVKCIYEPTKFGEKTAVVQELFKGVTLENGIDWTIPRLAPYNQYSLEIGCAEDLQERWCKKYTLPNYFRIVPLVWAR